MKRLPIGVEDFKELVDHQYYYIDKTMFIQDVLKEKVVLYTRPRRFGKTLNMSRRCPPRRALLFFLNQTKRTRVPFQRVKHYQKQDCSAISKSVSGYPDNT